MKKDIMGFKEVHTAAHNIESIERVLGHKIPVSAIDTTTLGDEILGLGEVYKTAHNISSIERARRPITSSSVRLFEYIWLFIFALAFLVFIGGALILTIL